MKPFIYVHELTLNGGGIWLGCDDRKAVEGAYTEGETGEEVITLYHQKDYKEVVDLLKLMKENNGMMTPEQWGQINAVIEGV